MAKYVAVRLIPRGELLDGEHALILNSAVYDEQWQAEDRAHRQKMMDAAIGPKDGRYLVLEIPDPERGTLEL